MNSSVKLHSVVTSSSFLVSFFFSSLDVHKRCPNYIQDTGISHLAHENTSFKANNTLLLSLIILHKQ